MKRIILLLMLLCHLVTQAQLKVGNNPTTINSSAVLDVESTTKGFLPPRMTTAQRTAIVSPAAGLTIFNTDTKALEVNTGTPGSPVWSSNKSGEVNNTALTSNNSPAGTSQGQMMYNTGSVQPTGLVYWDGSQWKSVASSGGNTTNNYTVVNNKTVTNNDSVINNNPVVNNDSLINNGQVFNNSTVTNAGPVINNNTSTFNGTSTFNNTSTFNKQAVFNDTAVFTGGMKVSNLPAGLTTDSVLVFEPTTKVMRRISTSDIAGNTKNVSLSSSTSPAGSSQGQMAYNTNASSGLSVGPVYWDGTKWVGANGSNIYNSDGTLTGTRTITANGNDLNVRSGASATNVRIVMGRQANEMDMGVAGSTGSGLSSTTQGDAWLKGYNGLAVGTSSSSPLRLETNYTERMRIDANGNVGIGTTSPNASAVLDIASTSKGVLLPRMSTTDRGLISNPATGLMIFNSTTNAQEINTGTPSSPVWSVLNGKNLYNSNDSLTSDRIITTSGRSLAIITGNIATNSHARLKMGRTLDEMDMGVAGSAGSGLSSTTPGDAWLKGYNGLAVGTSGSSPLRFETNYTERMRIDQSGNIGIGTVSPTANLEISSLNSSRIHIANTGDGQASLDFINSGVKRWRIINTATNNNLAFYDEDNGISAMSINGTTGNIGINGTAAASAALDINSTTKGFLAPRMTQAQRTAISSPATGLLVFQTDASSGYWYYTGSTWARLSSAGNLTTLIADASNVTGGSTNGTSGTKTVWSSSFTSSGGLLDFTGYGSLYISLAPAYCRFQLSIDGVVVGQVVNHCNVANSHITFPLNFKVAGIAAGSHTVSLAIVGNTSPSNNATVDNNDFFGLKMEER